MILSRRQKHPESANYAAQRQQREAREPQGIASEAALVAPSSGKLSTCARLRNNCSLRLNYSDVNFDEQHKIYRFVLIPEQVAKEIVILRIIVAITGASGSVYGIRMLEKLRRNLNTELHLVVSRSGERTLHLETGKKISEIHPLAHQVYKIDDIGARLASGSFPIDAMVVAPCSVRTMSAIAAGISSNLLLRAADVILKERKRLVLMVRETPFHLGHLRTMVSLTEMGAIIAPPIPGFYHHPETIMDLVDHSVDRVLDLIGLPDPDAKRWDPSVE